MQLHYKVSTTAVYDTKPARAIAGLPRLSMLRLGVVVTGWDEPGRATWTVSGLWVGGEWTMNGRWVDGAGQAPCTRLWFQQQFTRFFSYTFSGGFSRSGTHRLYMCEWTGPDSLVYTAVKTRTCSSQPWGQATTTHRLLSYSTCECEWTGSDRLVYTAVKTRIYTSQPWGQATTTPRLPS